MSERMQYRPAEGKGTGDSHLPRVTGRVQSLIEQTQRKTPCRPLLLNKIEAREMAEVLAEFGEDLHNDIGLWAAYEAHNVRCFGVPLPITARVGTPPEQTGRITVERVLHLLWVLYPVVLDGTIIAPAHPGLAQMAETVTRGLNHCFNTVPKESGVKQFLDLPNEYGWDAKRKLVWLGRNSYLFRLFYAEYRARHAEADRTNAVAVADDFICERCTEWSGLSPNDLLADVLDLPESDRQDLLSWSFRHMAPYLILTAGLEIMKVRNVVSDGEYTVRINADKNPFTVNTITYGSLIPWHGEWVWSGTQATFGEATPRLLDDIKQTFLRNTAAIAYRYCPDREAVARERCREMHEKKIAAQGSPLAVHPDGSAFKAALQEELRRPFFDMAEEERRELCARQGIPETGPAVKLPQGLVRSKHQIAVFSDPNGGSEIMDHFDELVSGLKNRSGSLSNAEFQAIMAFTSTDYFSPNFVRHMVATYGDASIRTAHLLPGDSPAYSLEYLLRRFKGRHFKKQYPQMIII